MSGRTFPKPSELLESPECAAIQPLTEGQTARRRERKSMRRMECTILTLNIFHDLPMYRHLESPLRADRRGDRRAPPARRRAPGGAACDRRRATSAPKIRDDVNRLCGGDVYRLDYAVADGAGDGEFFLRRGRRAPKPPGSGRPGRIAQILRAGRDGDRSRRASLPPAGQPGRDTPAVSAGERRSDRRDASRI